MTKINEVSKHTGIEGGHAKNVANFEKLISVCTGYGAPYNPSKTSLKLPGLNTLLTSALTSMANVKDKFNAWSAAVDAREILFAPPSFSKFITRILNALESSEVTEQKVADAKTITRKLTGKRATPKTKKTLDSSTTVPATETSLVAEHDEISSSQMSYDNRLDNFAKLINLLATETGYAPNEADLKVTALNTILASIKTKNTAVINAKTSLDNARINRNKILYFVPTSIYNTQLDAKKYVKSLFGATSPEYKLISKIKFIKLA
ncbi:MAG: hypothetical protein COS14_08125 [Bacteroidetes bacterium CG02_land_8_20_14_3_00_31_25]|nr:MAG: hypothetical protein COS14_08125 [Bacteroidetes bacterium CG02_land_8_20_14_3_00_31_25]